MILKIKTIAGKELEIDASLMQVVYDLKLAIEEREHIPPPQQKLIFNGTILTNDNQALSSNNFQSGNVIHMVIALRGG